MTLLIAVYLIFGLVLLTTGAHYLVQGASGLAARIGISPRVIGLTVVAFGTSAPELFVSVEAALSGQSDMALGNVVGSNIFNILFILGACALVLPLVVNRKLVKVDAFIMIAAAMFGLLFSLDGSISRFDGAVLFGALILYIFFSIREGKADHQASVAASDSGGVSKNIICVVAGLAMLVIGADRFLLGAVEVARSIGMSELVIGLTIVAAGTSLPEVATSIVATIKGEREIAVGNVVGSNIFNIFGVLGLSAVIHPISVAPAALAFDIPIMIAVTVACLIVLYTGFKITRIEGAILFLSYIAYTTYLVLASMQHEALNG